MLPRHYVTVFPTLGWAEVKKRDLPAKSRSWNQWDFRLVMRLAYTCTLPPPLAFLSLWPKVASYFLGHRALWEYEEGHGAPLLVLSWNASLTWYYGRKGFTNSGKNKSSPWSLPKISFLCRDSSVSHSGFSFLSLWQLGWGGRALSYDHFGELTCMISSMPFLLQELLAESLSSAPHNYWSLIWAYVCISPGGQLAGITWLSSRHEATTSNFASTASERSFIQSPLGDFRTLFPGCFLFQSIQILGSLVKHYSLWRTHAFCSMYSASCTV